MLSAYAINRKSYKIIYLKYSPENAWQQGTFWVQIT